MPDVIVDALVPAADGGDVYAKLRDLTSYPRYTDAVREVRVVALDEHRVQSHWSVNFRNGVLCWTEHDAFDDVARTIEFTQTDGDFHRFDGTWTLRQDRGDVVVRFACTFDLGMPSLAAIIDPIAREALVENVQLILHGLLGDDIAFLDPTAPRLAVVAER
ncbi:type II toxin-antitoxin system RatA family toxin [Salinispora fenicalii]|uniref:type II toxin-antitoxin system RatA family toxin n=1 Tax=Salinispora fenicalii TaxID=1137263 RepID=UPI0004889FA1|nr:SRPBCC family protein [Salinispora fenicalii]